MENFIAGLLLLLLTSKITGIYTRLWRIIIASVLCGLTGFIIFLPVKGMLSVIIRLLTGVLCTAAAFGKRELVKISAVFLIMTFMAGGAVMALMLWMQQPSVTHQGIIYMDAVTYIKLICYGILALGFAYWFVRLVRKRGADINAKGKVCFIIDGESYFFRAFADSGNSLREPISGKPVVLLDIRGAAGLPFRSSDLPDRYRVIPYRAVGTEAGNLDGIRTDKTVFQNIEIEDTYIAFYDGVFGEYEALVNKDFLERGLLRNV